MADQRFSGLSDEDLADIWYALAGAEIRHTDCFKHLVDATIYELELRKGAGVRPFLDLRFEHLRLTDVIEDATANQKSTTTCDPPVEN